MSSCHEKRNFAKSSKVPNFHLNENSTLFSDFQKDFLAQKKASYDENTSNEPDDIQKKPEPQNLDKISNDFPAKPAAKTKPKSLRTVKKFILKMKQSIKPIKLPLNSFFSDLACPNPNRRFSDERKRFEKLYRLTRYLRKIISSVMNFPLLNNIVSKFLSLPTFHPFQRMCITWDALIFLNTVFLFFYIPMKAGFDIMDDQEIRVFEGLEIVVYLLEFLVNLNTSQFIDGFLIQNRWKIWAYYQNQFIYDFLAILSLILSKRETIKEATFFDYFMNMIFFLKFKALKKEFYKIKEFFALKIHMKGFFEVCVLLVYTLFFIHFFACTFHFISISSLTENNWLSYYGIVSKTLAEQYFYSLYWSISTMLYVGYGDILPQNQREKAFCLITMMVGLFLYSYNINKIGSIFLDLTKEETKIQEKINRISTFMESKKITGNLQMRIRSYLKYLWETENESMNKNLANIIDSLSKPLRDEIYFEAYGKVVRGIKLFVENFSEEFLSEMTKNVEELTILKNETIFTRNSIENQSIFFVKSGEIEALYTSIDNNHHHPVVFKRLKANHFFGQFAFLTGFMHLYSTRASENTKLYKISRRNFLGILQRFPKDYELYCKIRDKIVLYHEFPDFDLKCAICPKKDHFINQCKMSLNLIIDPKKTIEKYLFSQNQIRSSFKRKKKKFNSLKSKKNSARAIETLKLLQKISSNNEIPKFGRFNRVRTSSESLISVYDQERMEEDFLFPENNNKYSQDSYDDNKLNLREEIGERIDQNKLISPIIRACSSNIKEIDMARNFDFYFPKGNVENLLRRYNKMRKKRKTVIEFDQFGRRILSQLDGKNLFQTMRERNLNDERSKSEKTRYNSFREIK